MKTEDQKSAWPKIAMSRASSRVWDVAVVGAGPAGSTAAIHLASRGHSVLLIDKESFPRDKICGDGIIPDAVAALKRAGLYDEVRRRSFETSLATIYSPSRFHFDVSGHFLTLKRFVLDEMIARKAIDSGASFCECKVADVRPQPDGTVLLSAAEASEPIQARIVMIATGASVELASRLGLVTRPGPSAVALRCYARSPVAIDRLIITYDRSISPGYAWIFPLAGGEFNIGCGITYKESQNRRANIRRAFSDFVSDFPPAAALMREAQSVTPLKGARLRCGLSGARLTGKGNILLIGETAGATFPFTGEGIGKAMETAEIAAEIASEALSANDFDRLKEFPDRLERELKPKYLGYQIAQDWFSRPWLTDFMARRISASSFLQRSIAGLVNETVDPREIFSLRGILRSFVS